MINRSKDQQKSNMATLRPDSDLHSLLMGVLNTSELENAANRFVVEIERCDNSIIEEEDLEIEKEDGNSTKLKETGNGVVVKIDRIDNSDSVDKDIEVKKACDNSPDHISEVAWDVDISDNTIMLESKLLDDAIYKALKQSREQRDTEHTSLQSKKGGDGECDKLLKYQPHTAMSPALIAEKQAIQDLIDDSDSSTHVAQTLVALWAARLEMHNEKKVNVKEETKPVSNIVNRDVDKQSDNNHKINHVDSKLLGNCVVKLCDIFKTPFQTEKTASIAPLAAKLKAKINRKVLKTKKSKTASSKKKKKCLKNKPLENEEYICDICGNTYNFRRGIVRHLRSHRKQKLYTCQICQFKGIHKIYKAHMRLHASEKNFICNLCKYKTSNKTHLNVHMTIHTGIKPFACVVCAYRCSQRSDMAKHMRRHAVEKRYPCTVCDFKCKMSGDMARHMRTHTGEKPHTCRVCEQKFSRKCHFLVHMNIHRGVKPYACDMCEYRTVHLSSLVVHKRTHTGEKPFVCQMCNDKFPQHNTLVAHMRIHTGEKPYVCHICSRKYAHRQTLMVHQKCHTDKNAK